MPTNTLQTYTVVGMKEEVDDKIYRVSPEETPFVSMIGRKSVDSTTPEWQRISLRAPASNAKVEGLDATYAAQPQPERLSNKRSEEHTSELQSLMRISYAVFCLKKK